MVMRTLAQSVGQRTIIYLQTPCSIILRFFRLIESLTSDKIAIFLYPNSYRLGESFNQNPVKGDLVEIQHPP